MTYARWFYQASAAAALTAVFSPQALAQAFPIRPIHVIVPYLPGGGVDTIARIIGQKLTDGLGQSVIIDNRPGGGSNIGSELAARAAPDGYTLLLASAANAVNMTLYSKPPYDLLRDFAPVTLIGPAPNVLVVHPSLPVKSVRDLIALAKARPGQLTFASAGIGSSNHISGELFRSLAGIDIVHVPYKGGSQAITDLIGGQVTMYFSSVPAALPQIKAAKIHALGVTSLKRFISLPDVPPIAEAGLPGYEYVNFYCVLVPAATPHEIIARLSGEIIKVLHMPDVKARLAGEGVDVVGSSPQELGAFIRKEIEKNGKLVRSARIRAD